MTPGQCAVTVQTIHTSSLLWPTPSTDTLRNLHGVNSHMIRWPKLVMTPKPFWQCSPNVVVTCKQRWVPSLVKRAPRSAAGQPNYAPVSLLRKIWVVRTNWATKIIIDTLLLHRRLRNTKEVDRKILGQMWIWLRLSNGLPWHSRCGWYAPTWQALVHAIDLTCLVFQTCCSKYQMCTVGCRLVPAFGGDIGRNVDFDYVTRNSRLQASGLAQ